MIAGVGMKSDDARQLLLPHHRPFQSRPNEPLIGHALCGGFAAHRVQQLGWKAHVDALALGHEFEFHGFEA